MRLYLFKVLVLGAISLSIGCGENPRIAEIEALSGDAVAGATLYEANCRWCHGSNGRGAHTMYPGGTLSPDLIETILEGLSGMPSFDNLSNQEIADIVAYIETFD